MADVDGVTLLEGLVSEESAVLARGGRESDDDGLDLFDETLAEDSPA